MHPGYPLLALADATTFAVLFYLSVFVLGVVVGLALALMFWLARKDRRGQKTEDQV